VKRQMIKVLALLTNNTEQFCGQGNGDKFKCALFTKFCTGLHFGYHVAAYLYLVNKTLKIHSLEDFLQAGKKAL